MKDPAFLFYPKDWLEGTAEMLPEEKGVYIDLLCYQHQKGSLPSDIERLARLSRLSVPEFSKIWDTLKDKFDRTDDRLVNRKLEAIITERSDKALKNRIIGTFAHVIKKLNLSYKNEKLLKSKFNVEELMRIDTEWNTERLTEWCLNAIAFIEDANKDEIKDEDKKGDKDQNYKLFVQAYFDFHEDRFGVSPQFQSKDGAGIKTIMKYLISEAEKAGKDADIQSGALRVWQFILQNWDSIPDDFIKTKMTKPYQIAANIDKILGYFKKPQKKSVTAIAAEKMKDSLELFKQRKNANSKS